MIFHVATGVALERPPLIDEFRSVVIAADTEIEALMIALQISSATSVMPVWAGSPDDVEHLPEEWIRS